MARFIPLVVALIILAIAVSWPRSELTSKTFINQIYSASGKIDTNATKAVWNNQQVPLPSEQLAQLVSAAQPTVLGDSTDEKWIDVDLDIQRVRAYEGGRLIYDFVISSGMPWTPTVTGEFRIWAKVRAQRMTGGDMAAGTFYDLPNVPFVQYFYKGYSFHGAYWHNNFGHPMSHGCVNMRSVDAQALYYWTNPALAPNQYSRTNIKPEESTRVVVHGTTPSV